MSKLLGLFCRIALFCLILSGCSGKKVVEIRVVATADVHGHVFDKDILDGEVRKGSLAKVATLLRNERKKNRNVIYLDAGDILQGSVEVYQDVTAQYYRNSLPAQAYNYLGCNAMALGNHDMAVGTLSFERFFGDVAFPVLGGNICFDRYGDYILPYTIIEKGGVTVAVVGLTTPIVQYTLPWDHLGELTARDPVETARYYVANLRDRVDVMIGLFHSGLEGGRVIGDVSENFVKEFVDEVPGFDMIVFGHDHSPYCQKMACADGDSVLIMNAGPYAEKAAVATIYVDYGQNGKPCVRTGEGELVDVTDLVPDAGFMKAVAGWNDDVNRYADSIIGSLSVPLESKGLLWRPTSMMNLLHGIQMNFFGAQISLASPVSDRTFFSAGDFSIRDAFSLYRFDNTMVSVMLKGSEIKNVLEYSADMFFEDPGSTSEHLLKLEKDITGETLIPKSGTESFISAAGINYTIDVTKPYGERVLISSMTDGGPFEQDRLYRTTINSFLYSGSESILIKGAGIDRMEMLSRLNCSSEADIRYYILTDFALKHESGRGLTPRNVCNWSLVPEKVVSGYLASDTLFFH